MDYGLNCLFGIAGSGLQTCIFAGNSFSGSTKMSVQYVLLCTCHVKKHLPELSPPVFFPNQITSLTSSNQTILVVKKSCKTQYERKSNLQKVLYLLEVFQYFEVLLNKTRSSGTHSKNGGKWSNASYTFRKFKIGINAVFVDHSVSLQPKYRDRQEE